MALYSKQTPCGAHRLAGEPRNPARSPSHWRRAKESNPHPFGATVFRTAARPFQRDPPYAIWYSGSDSNGHCSVPKTDASYQLGYRSMVRVRRFERPLDRV